MEYILQFHWLMQDNGEMKQKNYGHDSKLTSFPETDFLDANSNGMVRPFEGSIHCI
ncbi:hypothetical protein PBNK5_07420 [Pectobacterium brasiliense]